MTGAALEPDPQNTDFWQASCSIEMVWGNDEKAHSSLGARSEPRVRDPVKRLLARSLKSTDNPDRAGCLLTRHAGHGALRRGCNARNRKLNVL